MNDYYHYLDNSWGVLSKCLKNVKLLAREDLKLDFHPFAKNSLIVDEILVPSAPALSSAIPQHSPGVASQESPALGGKRS